MADITFEITKSFGKLADSRGGWVKEFNLVSWNGREPKFDIREWSPDHEKMGKGITFTTEEAVELQKMLTAALSGQEG